MSLPKDVLAKIKSEELREAAQAADRVPHIVIVEIDLPHPTMALSERPSLSGRPVMKLNEPHEQPATLAHVRRAMKDALGHEPGTYLPSSRAFIIEATGDQIGRVAAIPDVLAIWPNTRRS